MDRWLHVLVGGEARALPAADVREVARLGDLTPVPGAPAEILGVTNVHGRILVVLDARAADPSRSSWEARDESSGRPRSGDPLLLLGNAASNVALRVERILGVDDERPRPELDLAALLQRLGHSSGARGGPPSRPTGDPISDGSAGLLDAGEVRQLRDFFRDEATTHLAAADAALARAPDGSSLSELLRELHTLKGSAGAVGMTHLAAETHALEDRVLALSRHPAAIPAEERAAIAEALAQLRIQIALPCDPHDGPLSFEAGGADAVVDSGERAELRVEAAHVDALMESVGELVIDRARIVRKLLDFETSLRRIDAVAEALLDTATPALIEPTSDDRALQTAPRRAVTVDEIAALGESLARLHQVTSALFDDTNGLRRRTSSLQGGLQRIRTVAVSRLFARLVPAVAELAERAGRAVEVVEVGGDTSIDRATMDRLFEPLLQLLRNAIAHGIEPPETRLASQKPRAGRITLSARQRGDRIVLVVEDDGAGVDGSAVRRALVAAGSRSIAEAEQLDDGAILAALFTPGLSTRRQPDELAGRGMGLHAAAEAVARVGGTVHGSSVAGRGTRFTVRLPLTTAIVPAWLFKVAGHVYAVPSDSVVYARDSTREPWPSIREPSSSSLRFGETPPGSQLHDEPVLDLRALLGSAAPLFPRADAAPELRLACDGQRFTLRCDKLIGEREIVVKGLGALFARLPLYAGATLSGAGKVQLILDVDELARLALVEPAATFAPSI